MTNEIYYPLEDIAIIEMAIEQLDMNRVFEDFAYKPTITIKPLYDIFADYVSILVTVSRRA